MPKNSWIKIGAQDSTNPMVPDYIRKGGNTYRILTDHLGSVRLVVDVDNDSVIQEMEYDEFGRLLHDSNPGFQPFGFSGGLWDADAGMIRLGARDYMPDVGRWTSKDPVLFAGGSTNLYRYGYDDPVNFIDPTGTIPVVAVPFILAGAGGFATGVFAAFINGERDISDLLRAGVVGGVLSATSMIPGVGIGRVVVLGATLGAAGEITNQVYDKANEGRNYHPLACNPGDNTDVDVQALVVAAAGGALTGLAGGAATSALLTGNSAVTITSSLTLPGDVVARSVGGAFVGMVGGFVSGSAGAIARSLDANRAPRTFMR